MMKRDIQGMILFIFELFANFKRFVFYIKLSLVHLMLYLLNYI